MRDKDTGQFRPLRDSDYICSTWFERDRAHIRLEAPGNRTIFELWDEDVADAVESGYLEKPKGPRPQDGDWHQSAVNYARSKGLIK